MVLLIVLTPAATAFPISTSASMIAMLGLAPPSSGTTHILAIGQPTSAFSAASSAAFCCRAASRAVDSAPQAAPDSPVQDSLGPA